MKPVFSLVKVIDPHSHMPKEIKDALFDAYRGELSNGSYEHWTVGDHENEDVPDIDDDDEYSQAYKSFAIIDEWMLKHFVKGEIVMILYWW